MSLNLRRFLIFKVNCLRNTLSSFWVNMMRFFHKELILKVGSLGCFYSAKDILKKRSQNVKKQKVLQKLSPPDLAGHYTNKTTNKFHLLDLL